MAKKVDGRKKVKLTIELTQNDLCLFEDYNSCIPLCNKHKSFKAKPREEREEMTMYYECKDCDKIYKKWKGASQRIEGRLWEQLGKKLGW